MAKKLDNRVIGKIRKMYKEGESKADIARSLEVSTDSVRRYTRGDAQKKSSKKKAPVVEPVKHDVPDYAADVNKPPEGCYPFNDKESLSKAAWAGFMTVAGLVVLYLFIK